MDIDAARRSFPQLGLALYALEPGKAVTLEVHTPTGEVYTFTGESVASVLAYAFPPLPSTLQPQQQAEPTASVFD